MTVSLKEVIGKIEEICNVHLQIGTFLYGNISDVYKANTIEHTAVILDVNSATVNPTDISVTMTLSVVDKVLKGNENKIDVESETLLILGDLINIMQTDNTWRYCGVVSPPTAVRVVEKELDVVNGWIATVQLRLMKVNGLTDIPATGLPSPVGATATINVNGNLYDTVVIGEILDVLVQYANGTPVGTITGNIVVIPNPGGVCADATYTILDADGNILYTGVIASGGDLQQTITNAVVQNSDLSYNETVLAQGLLTLPNIRIRKSDLSLIEIYPSVQNYNVADSVVSNSDDSYLVSVMATDSLELPDTNYNIYLDGVLNQTFAIPTLKNETINISL